MLIFYMCPNLYTCPKNIDASVCAPMCVVCVGVHMHMCESVSVGLQ